MNKTLEKTLRIKMEAKGYSKYMINYWFGYVNSKKAEDNYVRNTEWIIGFGEFIISKERENAKLDKRTNLEKGFNDIVKGNVISERKFKLNQE